MSTISKTGYWVTDDKDVYSFNKNLCLLISAYLEKHKYKKVYDLTIPETFNFGLANGLQCADTADTGYVQRKLIKKPSELCVKLCALCG